MSNYKDYCKQREMTIKTLLERSPGISSQEIAMILNGSSDFAKGSLGGMVSRINVTIKKLNSEPNDKRSVATKPL